MEDIAGAVARRKPADVNKIEKPDMASIRRKRARRSGGDGDASSHRHLADRPKYGKNGALLEFEAYSLAFGGAVAHGYLENEVEASFKTFRPFFQRDVNIVL